MTRTRSYVLAFAAALVAVAVMSAGNAAGGPSSTAQLAQPLSVSQ